MGMLNRIFGTSIEYPELPEEHPVRRQLDSHAGPLADLIAEAPGPVQLVAGLEAVYAFIGRPPRHRFGLTWLTPTGLRSYQTLVEEHNFTEFALAQLNERLRQLYRHHEPIKRHRWKSGGGTAVVLLSAELAADLDRLLDHGLGAPA